MTRALQLASLGEGFTSPNPMVGAVLVHADRIIGEGYHARVGEAHAEVNALDAVMEQDRHLISNSTLFVTLEPCCIHGRTPPCTDLIIRHKIPKVVVGASDYTPGVYGRSLEILRQAGVEVVTGVCAQDAAWLARPRNVFVTLERPFITLKWAQSQDGFIGKEGGQVQLSNPLSLRWVHRLRHRCDAILIGSGTALIDNPQLTNRLYGTKQPIRVILDRRGRLRHQAMQLWNHAAPTWVFTGDSPEGYPKHVRVILLEEGRDGVLDVVTVLHTEGVSNLLVEGGRDVLLEFLKHSFWDEAYVAVCPVLLSTGVRGPEGMGLAEDDFSIGNDTWSWYLNRKVLDR